ncbi:hypothetical protein HY498_04225 [Candidatus Woesearchaeota archaeon]|nr:hypothetical protein [Candidatus Woesearchaeota archaeon]
MINKKGFSNLLIALDVVGFGLILLGGALIRYSKDEVISILGGLVMAGGVVVLGLSRLVVK